LKTRLDNGTWSLTMQKIPLSFPTALVSGLTLLGITSLTIYHFKLKFFNETTFEAAKNSF